MILCCKQDFYSRDLLLCPLKGALLAQGDEPPLLLVLHRLDMHIMRAAASAHTLRWCIQHLPQPQVGHACKHEEAFAALCCIVSLLSALCVINSMLSPLSCEEDASVRPSTLSCARSRAEALPV